ncbi:LOW QUALITY PROTEIN: uncharacterized protein LOC114928424 [Nylanderia fulva]|uniref:LOW QUALITY PROTEIN: uncharacterized protein LOC114928424 n=1 Tax=Nylanderia fulva TaxID=613905 RepID=UPI0010FB9D0E|nr:LOW QUALITY PROTEIN: uncharacterized protein LOC114928424 [Nylanderia fulva]
MYITLDDEELRRFVVCEFYGVETCFCWNEDKLVRFPYTGDSVARNMNVLTTPYPLRQVRYFNDRVFVICIPQGAYKLSRTGEFALLSKNALDMGSEFCQVVIAKNDGVYLDDKRVKSSSLLFPVASNTSEEDIRTFSLILEDTETQFLNCFIDSERKRNVCVITHDKRLFALSEDNVVQLIYTCERAIVDIVPVRRRGKVAALLLLIDVDMVILVHGEDYLVFEKIHLGKHMINISAFCACFNTEVENILWIIYCDRFKMYYMRKELFVDEIQEIRVEERKFRCIQYYKPNIVLGLSQQNELVELPLDKLENSLSFNAGVNLNIDMFQKTDLIMERIYAKAKELNVLYESKKYEQDNYRRINLYVSKEKLQVTPHIEVSTLCNYHYLELNITEKLPTNSYLVFTIISMNHSIFCMKKITDAVFTLKFPINTNKILCSSNINIDLITWMNEQQPWCLIQNFINSSPQDLKGKETKKDKTAFINAKIASLQKLIADKDLNMTKLSEIKRIIRAEL